MSLSHLDIDILSIKLKTEAGNGQTANCLYLISRGAPIISSAHATTALHCAASNGRLETAIALLDAGFDGSAEENSRNMTVSQVAAASYSPKAVETTMGLILDPRIPTTNSLGRSILHEAVKSGKVETVVALLDSGMDVNVKTNLGWNLLHEAASARRDDMVRMLISRGVDLNAKTSSGDRPIHLVLGVETLIDLAKAGVDIDVPGAKNLRLIHHACKKSFGGFVEALIALGAKTDYCYSASKEVEECLEKTHFASAARCKNVEIMKLHLDLFGVPSEAEMKKLKRTLGTNKEVKACFHSFLARSAVDNVTRAAPSI